MEGRKSPSPIDLAHGLYNSLYYRTSRDLEAASILVSGNGCHLLSRNPNEPRVRSKNRNSAVIEWPTYDLETQEMLQFG